MKRVALRDQVAKAIAENSRLLELLMEAEEDKDEFVLLLFQARKHFRLESDRKQSRRGGDEERRSFLEAQRYGYQGSLAEWRHLLRIPLTWPKRG